jgi:hypothetical protein
MGFPDWWKEGTVVKIVCTTRCDLGLDYEGKIGILGPVDTVVYYGSSGGWRELITLDDTFRPKKDASHPNGWWWVNVKGVEPVEAIDVQEG